MNTRRYLVVGDPHVTVEELEDCERLLDLICESVKKHSIPYVFFLGDLHHNHSVVRAEVLAFWNRAFKQIADLGASSVALVGNHDRVSDTSSKTNTLFLYQNVEIIDRPIVLSAGLGVVPWEPDPVAFVESVKSLCQSKINKISTLFCHQTFDGSKYENGMYAKDGISLTDLPSVEIISGHIHTGQEFGSVWYPGSPRWRTIADANVAKYLYLIEVDESGFEVLESIPTSTHCSPILSLQDYEEQPLGEDVFNDWVTDLSRARLHIAIHGSASFVQSARQKWVQKGARVSTYVTAPQETRLSESEGIPKAIRKFLELNKSKYQTPPEVLENLIVQRLGI